MNARYGRPSEAVHVAVFPGEGGLSVKVGAAVGNPGGGVVGSAPSKVDDGETVVVTGM